MANPQTLKRWYAALSKEDCVDVMQLLNEAPSLLMEGSKADPSRWFDGDTKNVSNARMDRRWKGRTALHVGARRGCVDLVRQVLVLCLGVEAVATAERDDDDDYDDGSKGAEENGQSNMGDEGDPQDDREHAKVVQNTSVARGRPQRTLKTAVLAIIGLNRLGHGKRKETAHDLGLQRSSNPLESKMLKEEIMSKETVGIFSDSSKHSFDARVGNSGYSLTSKDLLEFLLSKDGESGLEALAMSAIHYNPDIIDLLMYAFGQCDTPPYSIRKGRVLPPKVVNKDESAHRDRLKQATAQFIASLKNDPEFTECLRNYSEHGDFNFLPPEEYFFHFLSSSDYAPYRVALWKEVRSLEGSLWRFLLELKDGQGRTPFHVALDEGIALSFVKLFGDGDEEMLICALTSCDGAGRSPLHRAVTSDNSFCGNIKSILEYSVKYEEVRAMWHTSWRHPVRLFRLLTPKLGVATYWTLPGNEREKSYIRAVLSELSVQYGFRRHTHPFKPLHLAIIHRRYESAKHLIRHAAKLGWSLREISSFKWYWQDSGEAYETYFDTTEAFMIEWGLIEFACVVKADMGFIKFLLTKYTSLSKSILKGDDGNKCEMQKVPNQKARLQSGQEKQDVKQVLSDVEKESEEYYKERTLRYPWQALHVVASFGNSERLTMFLDDPQWDPFIEDFEQNNALHYVMNIRPFVEFPQSILDFVSCDHFSWRQQSVENEDKQEDKDVEKSRTVEREACVNLLLQVGCDVFRYNKKKKVPNPKGNLIKNAEFCSWWNDKQEKEFAAIQNKLNIASNAISVTAALVATASYVGPLQPPLGYAADPVNQMQYENVWVAIFIFCDTASFYFAVVAIILAIIPCLPMWQQPMIEELQKTQKMVTLAVSALFPSIVCVLIAFASSSMAVVSARLLSSIGGRLTIVTLCMGAPLILGAFFLLFIRLLGLLFPGYWWARYMYKRCI